jgi:hypothetical protein
MCGWRAPPTTSTSYLPWAAEPKAPHKPLLVLISAQPTYFLKSLTGYIKGKI